MNILITTPGFVESGAKAPDLIGLAVGLVKRGHSVCVLCTNPNGLSHEVISGVKVFRYKPLLTLPLPYAIDLPLKRIGMLVNKFDIELIHAVYEHVMITAASALFSKMTRIPYVLDIQGSVETTGRRTTDVLAKIYDHTIAQLIARNSSMAVVLSESLKKRALSLGCSEEKIAIKPSGIDIDYFNPNRFPTEENRRKLGFAQDEFIVGFAGRLVPLKGFNYLFQAASAIKQKIPKLRVLIVGDGPEKSRVIEMAKASGVPVTVTGWVSDTRPYYSIMDIFVLSSLSEGLPNVVLESMAMKKPTIATNVGGTGDLVDDDVTGYLVRSKDADILAQKMLALYESSDLRKYMGDSSRDKIEQSFSWDQIIKNVETIYERLIQESMMKNE